MALTENDLKLEVGTEGWEELTTDEQNSLLSYSSLTLAALKAFDLLRKKYRPTYRLGRAYEDLSSKYEHYAALYREYQRRVAVGEVIDATGERNFSDS